MAFIAHRLVIWVDLFLMMSGLSFEKRLQVLNELKQEHPEWEWDRIFTREEWNDGPYRKTVSDR